MPGSSGGLASAEARPLQPGSLLGDLAVAGPDPSSLEAAHRAIDLLVDQHRQAAEATGRTRQRLEDWQRQLSLQQMELDGQRTALEAERGEVTLFLPGEEGSPNIISDLRRRLAT